MGRGWGQGKPGMLLYHIPALERQRWHHLGLVNGMGGFLPSVPDDRGTAPEPSSCPAPHGPGGAKAVKECAIESPGLVTDCLAAARERGHRSGMFYQHGNH